MAGYHFDMFAAHTWLVSLTTLLLVGLAVYSWQRRTVPGAYAFALGALLAAPAVVGMGFEVAARDPADIAFWQRFTNFWLFPSTLAVVGFILDYLWPGRWLNRRTLLVFILLPVLVILIIANGLDQVLLAQQLGRIYSYALSFISMGCLLWLFVRSPQRHWPAAIMVLAQIGGRMIYAVSLVQPLYLGVSLNVLAIAFVFLVYALALFGFHIFEPATLARHIALDQMPTGMLVLNRYYALISLNPAARRMLGLADRSIPATLPLPLAPALLEAAVAPVEVHLGQADAPRTCMLSVAPLVDWRGLDLGYLLLLHDITAQQQAQAQLIVQQRALAALQERERLARELHDSLGQSLAATHMHASVANQLLAQGRLDQAAQCLNQITELSLLAEADVRDYLLGAKTAFSPDQPFVEVLRQYVERFRQQYQLAISLDVPPDLATQGLSFAIEVQLLRIIQEALSNVRKHAAAQQVQIRLVLAAPFVEVTITDDGRGFDPTSLDQHNGFGLQAIRERVSAIGGTLTIKTQPGSGTQIRMRIPHEPTHPLS